MTDIHKIEGSTIIDGETVKVSIDYDKGPDGKGQADVVIGEGKSSVNVQVFPDVALDGTSTSIILENAAADAHLDHTNKVAAIKDKLESEEREKENKKNAQKA